MTDPKKNLIHGSAVAINAGDAGPSAVLIRGFSGRGKSDLAFRLIGLGASLISDDQVSLDRRLNKVFAEPVENIRGLLEVRGIGLMKFPVAGPTLLKLIVDLVPREDVPRLPERTTVDIMGVPILSLKLHAFDSSTPFKVMKAIELAHNPDLLV